MNMEQQSNILIVGAGPCGLTAAVFLTHYGIPCRIIDKKSGPTLTSNAVGVQPRTLELLEEVGLTQQFLSVGVACEVAHFYHMKKQLASLHFSKYIRSAYRFLCMVPQYETERILLDYLAGHGVTVEYSTEATQLEQHSGHVITTINVEGQSQQYRSDWLIAADGYHSTMRDICQIDYEGDDYSYQFIMIDAPVDVSADLKNKLVIGVGRDFSLLSFPMKQSNRLIAEVSKSKRYQVEPEYHVFNKMAKEVIPYDFNINEASWQSTFFVHERLAKQYQAERVFFVGDAAHAHIPAAAQGMNTGMQDAINLAWKLARVVKGSSTSSLLHSYNQERRPVAQRVLKMTGAMGNTLLGSGPILKSIIHICLPLISRIQSIQKLLTNAIAEVDVNYRHCSSTTGKGTNKLRPGDRITALPSDTLKEQYWVIDYMGDVPSSWKEQYSIQIIKANEAPQNEIPALCDCYCVVRPDRYVGHIGNSLDELRHFLTEGGSNASV